MDIFSCEKKNILLSNPPLNLVQFSCYEVMSDLCAFRKRFQNSRKW